MIYRLQIFQKDLNYIRTFNKISILISIIRFPGNPRVEKNGKIAGIEKFWRKKSCHSEARHVINPRVPEDRYATLDV